MKRTDTTLTVIGAGLAGCEAAYQAAERGVPVRLIEMKPEKRTPAHKSDFFAELVCSNSLRNADPSSAIGLLKEELRLMGSVIMEAADHSKVDAGGALAVDRNKFSEYVTEKVKNHPQIEVEYTEADAVPDGFTVIATGPLTSEPMSRALTELIGDRRLSFFDAAAPIVDAETINMGKAFFASRYGKGSADYINCPMNEEEYAAFYNALVSAETAELHEFDRDDGDFRVFEGCMPVEVMASRGVDTLRFGPMKPVGITHPETGERYYAVVQLRRENAEGTMFNLVGFQTHLTFPEQRRVFRMIPGLELAEFLRYGVMHRNTFLDSPGLLARDYSLRGRPELFFAGQMTGVEGYIESAGSGFVCGVSAAAKILGRAVPEFPGTTMIGAMARYVSEGGTGEFQPMNANFGIIDPLEHRVKGGRRVKYAAYSERALAEINRIAATL